MPTLPHGKAELVKFIKIQLWRWRRLLSERRAASLHRERNVAWNCYISNEFTPSWWWCYLWLSWKLVTWEDCDTRKREMLNKFTMRWENLAIRVVGRRKIDKTICYFVDFYNYVRRQVEMDKLAKNFGAFVTHDADLLPAYIILDASELKCRKFMKFQISLRDWCYFWHADTFLPYDKIWDCGDWWNLGRTY